MTSDRAGLEHLVQAANRARAERAAPVALPAHLGDPDCRLVAYGTLRPGEPNGHVLADCRGTWGPATVAGELATWHGYPILHPDASGEPIAVMVLESEDLPRRWPRLDRFEGPAYRREWIVYEHADGCGVGSVYVQA